MAWWVWIGLGLGLMGLEALTPGSFDALFLGLAALVVGTVAGMGLLDLLWAQVALYSILAVGWLFVLRKPLRARFTGQEGTGDVDTLVGEVALPLAELKAGATGQAELRGTPWTARNGGPGDLTRGQRCRVARVDGLTLWIEPE